MPLDNKYNIKSEDPAATKAALLKNKVQLPPVNLRSDDPSVNKVQKLLYDYITSKSIKTYKDYLGKDQDILSKEAGDHLKKNGVNTQDIEKFQAYLRDYTGSHGYKYPNGKISNFVDGDFGSFTFDAFMKLKARDESENEYFLKNPGLTGAERKEIITGKLTPYIFTKDKDNRFIIVGDVPENQVNAPPGNFPVENKKVKMNEKSVQLVHPSVIPKSGVIKGPGTPKSDSITTKYPEGTLVVPVEKVDYAKELYRKYINKDIPKSRPSGRGTMINVSDQEFIFTPEDLKYLKNRGADITPLLPYDTEPITDENNNPSGAEGLVVENNDKVQVLYDNFSKDYDLGTIDEFRSKLAIPEKRKAFYDGVSEEYDLGDYASFENKVSGSLKKKVEEKSPLPLPFIGAQTSTTGVEKSPYAPEGLESVTPSTSSEEVNLSIPKTVGTGTRGESISNTEPETIRDFGAMDGFLNAVDRGMKSGEIADILALGRVPSKDELRQISKLKREQSKLPSSKPYEDFNKAQTVGEQVKLLASNPVEIASQLLVEPMAAMLRHGYSRVIAGAGEGAAIGGGIGAIGGGVGAIPGSIAGAGLGILAGMTMAGYNIETASSILESLQDAGIDVTDEDSLIKGFEDKNKLEEARNFAMKRAVPIALFDIVSGGIGGKILGKPAKSIVGKVLKTGAEAGVQSGLAGAGEATAQLVSEGKITPTEVFAESLGEIAGGAPEIAVGTIIEKTKNGQPVIKDIAANFVKKEVFSDMVDISEGIGQITPEQTDVIKQQYDQVQNAKEKTPEEFKSNPTIIEGVVNKDILQKQLATIEQQQESADEAFKPLFEEKKKVVQDQINLIDENIARLTATESALSNPDISETSKNVLLEKQKELQGQLQSIESKPLKPTENATQERIIEKDNQQEYIGADAEQLPTETGDSNKPIESGEIKEKEKITETADGKYLIKKTAAGLEITDKITGRTPSKTTQYKAIMEYEGKVDYLSGEKAPDLSNQVSNPEQAYEYIADNSSNPAEILQTYQVAINEKPQVSYKEEVISENIGKIKRGGYLRFGDENTIGMSKAQAYFNKDGRHIDDLAIELSEIAGVEITPQDIVDFIDKYPNGPQQTKAPESLAIKKLKRKFESLTGLKINERTISHAYKQTLEKDNIDYQKYLQQEGEDLNQLENDYYKQLKKEHQAEIDGESEAVSTPKSETPPGQGDRGEKEKSEIDKNAEKQKSTIDISYGSIEKFKEAVTKVYDKVRNTIPIKTITGDGDIIRGGISRLREILRRRTTIEGFKEQGYVDFTNQKVNSPQDIADLFQIYRSPLIEKTHLILTDKDGKILSNSAITLGIPGQSAVPHIDFIQEQYKVYGAANYYLLHNHPSGNHFPSDQDIKVTKEYGENSKILSLNFGGHVIINSEKFTFIDNKGIASDMEYKNPPKMLFTTRVSILPGNESQDNMFLVAKALLKDANYDAAIVYLTPNFSISGYDILPADISLNSFIELSKKGIKETPATNFIVVHNGKFSLKSFPEGMVDLIKVENDKTVSQDFNISGVKLSNDERIRLWENTDEYKKAQELIEEEELRTQAAKGLKEKEKQINTPLSVKKASDIQADADNIIKAKLLPLKEVIQAGFKPLNKIQEKIFGEQFDRAKEWVARQVKKGNQSSNIIKRWGSQFITSWSNSIPRTQKDLQEKRFLKGNIGLANEKFEQALRKFHELVGNNVESLEKVHQVLDPEFYADNESLFGKKVMWDDLTDNEKALAQTLRNINDYIHDWNFSMGLIDLKTYMANKGKYIARLYNAFEIPEDAQTFLEQNELPIGSKKVKLITDIFKAREEINDWKKNNIVRDPVYLTMKRMRETEVNASILAYIDHIAQQRGMVNKEPRKGFTQLNGKGYGKLNGMYVPNYIAEDFQGFFFGNQLVDMLYDITKVYDRNQLLQFLKRYNTVYNPGVQLGNNSSNFVFAFLLGIDPITMASQYPKAFKELKNKGEVYQLLVKNGIMGSDVITGDLRPLTAKTEAIEKEVDGIQNGILDLAKKIDKTATDIYSGSDDIAKISAFMALKEYGYSDAKAIELVYNGFQNYAAIGKIWDLASKTLVFGNRFIKFQADLQRILPNAAFRRPLSAAMFIGILKGIAAIASKWSGEDEEKKEIRENRKFIPKIILPEIIGGDVPLVYKTPVGEVNLARYLSPYYTYDRGDMESPIENFSRYLPFQVKLIEGREAGSKDVFFPKQDPLLGPWVSAIIDDIDFRGISIQDPTSTKYMASGATSTEKILNTMNYIARSEVPLYATGQDMYLSWNYGTDFYDRSKTPAQVFLSTFVKVQDFKDSDYKKTVEKEVMNIQYKVEDYEKQLNGIVKTTDKQIISIQDKLKEGSITQRQYDAKYRELIESKEERYSDVIDGIAKEQQKMNELTTKYANILK